MITKQFIGRNVFQYTYWDNALDSPLGILWVRGARGESGKKVALLLNAMTVVWYRHKGVCTELHQEVLKEYDVLLSASGSDEGGKEFLKKFGFTYNKELDIWSFTKKE